MLTLNSKLSAVSFFLDGTIPRSAQVMIYGAKGAGKSTLAAQVAGVADAAGMRVSCIITEQTAADHNQLLRSLGISATRFDVRELADPAALIPPANTDLLIIDSMNGLGQIRRQADYGRIISFIQLCRRRGVACLLLSHATKAGTAAGPSAIQHAVDAVIRLSRVGGNHLMEVEKRRRIGSWATQPFLKEVPLILGPKGFVANPHADPVVASAAGFSRARLVSVQALVCLPARRLHCPFLPARRMRQLLATLQQHADIDVDLDQIGLSLLTDGEYSSSLDLALAVATAASYRRQQVPPDVVCVGAVGLNGVVQPIADDAPAVGLALTDTSVRLFISASSKGLIEEMVPKSVNVVGVSSVANCLGRLGL